MTATAGSIRFNTDSSKLEIYNGDKWWNIDSTSPQEQTGGTRGLVFNRYADPSYTNAIDYINIATTGNAADFGDVAESTNKFGDACASRTRGIYAGGRFPSNANIISFVTVSSTGNTADFGDLLEARRGVSAGASTTRGVIIGGNDGSNSDNIIQYITIASTGNAVDFGDSEQVVWGAAAVTSPTRMVSAGGNSPYVPGTDNIEYITIATTGNSANFGELKSNRYHPAPLCNSVRGVFAGGINNPASPGRLTSIDTIIIASLGDAVDYGDVNGAEGNMAGMSSSTRGVTAGSIYSGSYVNTMTYKQLESSGDTVDFGDLTAVGYGEAASNGHGGLG